MQDLLCSPLTGLVASISPDMLTVRRQAFIQMVEAIIDNKTEDDLQRQDAWRGADVLGDDVVDKPGAGVNVASRTLGVP